MFDTIYPTPQEFTSSRRITLISTILKDVKLWKICPRSIPQTGLIYPSFLRATRRFLFLIELHISSVHHPPIFPRSTPQRRSLPISLARNPDPGYHSSPINENVKWLNELFSPGLYFLEASFFLKICSLQLRTIEKVSSNHEQSLVAPGYRARISVDDFTL